MELLNKPADIDWLFDTHLKAYPKLRGEYKSFILYGNEDCPDKIELYKAQDPLVGDSFLEFTRNEDGEYVPAYDPMDGME
jgi:hypothetical protein